MLQAILEKLDPAMVAEAGLTLHGLHVEPGEGGARVSLMPRPAPYEPGAVFLPPSAMREVARFLAAAADVIEDAKPQEG